MATYSVLHDYHYQHRHLLAGETIELSDADADFIMRDAGQCLALVAGDPGPLLSPEQVAQLRANAGRIPAAPADESASAAEDSPKERAADAPPSDRQQKRRARRQLDRAGDPESGSAGAITRSTFGAVKDQ